PAAQSRSSPCAVPARARRRPPCSSAKPASKKSPTSPAACCAGAPSASRSRAAPTDSGTEPELVRLPWENPAPMAVRTRFAPSPTGYLHIGGARTALFSWAYARHHGGQFILRVEDTDLERSTEASVAAIIDGLKWLGIVWDEGPFFQMKRLARYREAADRLIAAGHAYNDYLSREELEALRHEQLARNEKPKYDGRWRPERA